jgi:NCS2 family nucleobase:cation symporter-2
MTSAAHPVDAALSPGRAAAEALQHVLVMYAGAIALPLVVGAALKLPRDQVAWLTSASPVACGLATLVQCLGFWRFGIRLPVVMGVTLASLAPVASLSAGAAPIATFFGAVIAAGILAIAVAPFAGRLVRYFSPLVTGSIVVVIGLTLLRTGMDASSGFGAKSLGAAESVVVVALVVATILVARKLFEGVVASLAVLIGLAVGYACAVAFGAIEWGSVRDADWLAPVSLFRFGPPVFEPTSIVALCVVTLVVMVESTGMFLALGDICGRAQGPSDIARGLSGVGLGSILAGVVGAFPLAPMAQNIGLVALSDARSRWATAGAGVLLVALGFVPKLSALVASLPASVTGATALLLSGMVAATGVRILSRADLRSRDNQIVIALSLAAGMIPMVSPTLFAVAPKWSAPLFNSGITLAAVSAVLLNVLFNGTGTSASRASRLRGAETEP